MICVYPADCTDFSTNGNGTLSPLSANVTETLNGEYELELVHPIDEAGKWQRLVEGCILRAPVPAAMTPRVSMVAGEPGSPIVIYRVSTVNERLRLRAEPGTDSPILGHYREGTEVIVLDRSNSEWYEVTTPDGKRGYMYASLLTYVRTETASAAVSEVIEPRRLRDQPFRIYRVVPELDKVTVYARHIFYDLLDNMIRSYKPTADTPGASVVQGIGENCLSDHLFSFRSDLDAAADDVSFTNVNPVEALLGEGGVTDKYGGELARDWYDVYLVKRVGHDSNVQIREGKNLLGISYDVDLTDVTTRIMPTGEDADGNILYLPELYADSPNASAYPHIKWLHLPVDSAKEVTKGSASELKSKDQCYAEMRSAAQNAFDAGCDMPTVTLSVDFINCADTEEYRQYGFLQNIFLGDTVRVIAPRIGVWVSMRMTQYTYDCLTKRYTAMTLGSVADTVAGNVISARQLPGGIISGAKLAINSVGTGQIRSGAVGALQVQQAAIQTAHIEDASITRAKIAEALIDTLNVNAVTAVRADIRQLVAGSATVDQLYVDLATIAVAQLTTANITNANIDWAEISNLTAEVARLAKAQIPTANIVDANITWANIESLNTAIASVADARIGSASITTAQIADLRAQVAGVITLAAQDGRFDFAKVRDLVAGAMILEEGIAGTVYIKNLVATHANFVGAIIGELVLKGTDDKYYEVEIQSDGTIRTNEATVSSSEIAAGETTDGCGIVATTANVASLNAGNIKADSAIIGSIFTSALTADKISASEAFLASATIPEIRTAAIQALGDSMDLSANASIRLMVGNINVGGTNLFKGTQDFSGTDWTRLTSGWTVSSNTYNGCKIASKSVYWNCMSQKVPVESGSTYTYSAWIKASSAQTVQFISYREETTGHCTVDSYPTGRFAAIGTDWTRVVFTTVFNAGGIAEPGVDVQNNGVTWYICGIKFERGNKATDWSPHPDDIYSYTNAQITILNNSISSKASQSSVDGLTTRMSTAESKITPNTIVNTVRSSTEYTNDLNGKVSTATLADYSTTSQTATAITAAVGAVNVGGTNLFTGTQLFDDSGQWTRLAGWTVTATTCNGCIVAQKTAAWNCMSQKITVEAGETYTYSAWVKASSTQRLQWLFYRGETTGHCTVEGNNTGTDVVVGTTWQRVSFTKTVASGGIAEPGIDVQNSGVTWYICGIKFERGNKATDWCAAEGEFYAGSTVRMTKDGFYFGGTTFDFDVPGDEGFHLDPSGGSMQNLTVKKLNAPNVARIWTGGTYVQVGPGKTYASLAEFANAINNKVLPSKDSVSVVLTADQTGTIYLGGMSGMGGVIIYGNGYSFNGALTIAGTSCYMWIEGLTVSGDLTLNRCRFVRLDNMMFNKSSLALTNGTTCWARKCQWANTNTCFSISLSRLIAWKCRGGNSNGNAIWGIGAIVQWDTSTTDSSPWQSGESTNMRPLGNVNLTASLTVPSNISTAVTATSLNGTTPTPPSTITTTSFSCKASKTAYAAGSTATMHWHGDNRLRQGYYDMGGSGKNEQYGCFWFDTSALSGKTIKSALLTLTRIAGYGRSSEVSVRLYTTPLAGGSGNPVTSCVDHGILGTIANGETKQFTIPVAAISAGANKGFMLRIDDGAVISGRSYSGNYAHFYGYGESNPPVLTVTYQ